MLRRLRIIGLIVLLGGTLTAARAGEPEAPLLDRSSEPFRITHWWSAQREALSEEQVDLMVEAGLNYLQLMGHQVEHNRRALAAASKYPWVEAIVHDGRLSEVKLEAPDSFQRIDDIVKDYRSYPAFKGFYVIDEPSATRFPWLEGIYTYTRERWPEVTPYVNLYPNYCPPHGLGTATYAEHIEQYLAIRPPLLSYDHYPFYVDSVNEAGWFSNLEEVRRQCLGAGVPYWVIIQFVEWPGMRLVNEAQLRWSVYSALAYGFKSISYFCYFTPGGQFKNGAIEPDGRVHPERFALMKKVNRDLHALGPVLMALCSERVYRTGLAPEQGTGVPEDGWIRSVEGKWIIGELQGQRGSYVLLANGDYEQSQEARIRWAPEVQAVYRVSKQTGRPEPVRLRPRKGLPEAAFSLAAGDGELYRLEWNGE